MSITSHSCKEDDTLHIRKRRLEKREKERKVETRQKVTG